MSDIIEMVISVEWRSFLITAILVVFQSKFWIFLNQLMQKSTQGIVPLYDYLFYIWTYVKIFLGDDITFFGFGDIASYRKGSASLYT